MNIIEDYVSKIEQAQRTELVKKAIEALGDLSNDDVRDLLSYINSIYRKKTLSKIPTFSTLYYLMQMASRAGTVVNSARVIKNAVEERKLLMIAYALAQLGISLI